MNTLRRRGELARDELRRLNAGLARTASVTVDEAQAVVRNARRKLRAMGPVATGRARATVQQLEQLTQRVSRIAAQTHQRVVDGETPEGATRLVSLHDPDARPIRKGRLGRPVEFGYKAQVVDNADGIVLDWTVEPGNPADAPQLPPAIERIRTGTVPRTVTADRGYGEAAIEATLTSLGVAVVRIPRKGRPGTARRQLEASRPFQRTIR